MHPYNELFRAFITQWIREYRKAIHATQEYMAEQLRISTRCYSDLEKERNGCYAATLMFLLLFLLLFLPETEVLRLRAEFCAAVEREDNHGAA